MSSTIEELKAAIELVVENGIEEASIGEISIKNSGENLRIHGVDKSLRKDLENQKLLKRRGRRKPEGAEGEDYEYQVPEELLFHSS